VFAEMMQGTPQAIASMATRLVPPSQRFGKMATAADVEKAAVELEAVFAKRPAVAKQVGQIGRRFIKAGRLDMYGTPPARVYLKKWADKYAPTR